MHYVRAFSRCGVVGPLPQCFIYLGRKEERVAKNSFTLSLAARAATLVRCGRVSFHTQAHILPSVVSVILVDVSYVVKKQTMPWEPGSLYPVPVRSLRGSITSGRILVGDTAQ